MLIMSNGDVDHPRKTDNKLKLNGVFCLRKVKTKTLHKSNMNILTSRYFNCEMWQQLNRGNHSFKGKWQNSEVMHYFCVLLYKAKLPGLRYCRSPGSQFCKALLIPNLMAPTWPAIQTKLFCIWIYAQRMKYRSPKMHFFNMNKISMPL